MRRRIERFVLGILLLPGLAAASQTQASQPFRWWKSEQFQKNLGLTPDQVSRVDAIFQSVLPTLRKGREELDKQEEELSRLIALGTDEAQVTRQVDKVEAIRAELNKKRTLMLLHMRQVLTPDQRVRFKAQRDQAEREQRAAGKPQDEHKQ